MTKQKPKPKEVKILHSIYDPRSGTVVPAGSILKATEAKEIPDAYKVPN